MGGEGCHPASGFPNGRAEDYEMRPCLRTDLGGRTWDALWPWAGCLVLGRRLLARAPTFFLLYGVFGPKCGKPGPFTFAQTGREREERQAKVLGNEKRASEKEPRCPFYVTVLLPQYWTWNWWLDWVTSMAVARPTVYNCLCILSVLLQTFCGCAHAGYKLRTEPLEAGLTFWAALGFAVLQEVQYVGNTKTHLDLT